MKKLILSLLIVCNSATILISFEETEDSQTTSETTVDKPKAQGATGKSNLPARKTPADTTTNGTKINSKKPVRSERKMFINSQDNPISMLITDKDNKLHLIVIPAGGKKTVEHVPLHIKKIVGKGNYQYKDIPISGTALNSYSVFVFAIDNTLEQFHFIDIKQKEHALARAKNALREARLAVTQDKHEVERLTKKIEDLQEQTIYFQ